MRLKFNDPIPPPYWEPLARRLGLPAMRCRTCGCGLRCWDFNGYLFGKKIDQTPIAQCEGCFNKN